MKNENKIILGDCIDFMHNMPDKSIDLIITDPPYGINENSHRQSSRGKLAKTTDYGSFDWDKKLPRKYFEEMLRISKNQVIFGGNYYADWLPASSCWLVWDKDNMGSNFADCELAWTSFKTAVRKYKWRWNGMLQENMKNKEKRVHPTQKPLPLMRWIIQQYAKPADIILDPFAGSGTTLIAARELNNTYIGIEKEEKYYQIIQDRLRQQVLF